MKLEINIDKKTAVVSNSKELYVKKFFFNNNKFKNEIEGYLWYFKKKINVTKKKNVTCLNLPYLSGYQIKFWRSITKNKKEILQVLKHYKKFWPINKKKKVPFHGDLTFSNIIFNDQQKLRFIDWEDFKKKEVWGLDICYFLLSVLILPALSRKKKNIFNEEYIVFKDFWDFFFLKNNFKFLKDPINYLKTKKLNRNFFLKKINKKILSEINSILKKK